MTDIARRKDEHLDIAARIRRVRRTGGFDAWRLDYLALPEIALADVDLRTEIAGKTLKAPLIIGAMTGGTDQAQNLNRSWLLPRKPLALALRWALVAWCWAARDRCVVSGA